MGPEGRGFESLFTDHIKESLLIEQAFVVSGHEKWDLNLGGVRLMFKISSSPIT
ncbi:hypothetical protein VCR17J2_710018 [Vibrio coralliirubri]|nr:hypothetical protein VCR17J2_710018 [Vibrio coralliirubri]